MTELDIVAFLTRCLDEAQARAELAQQVIAGSWDCWEVVAQQLHACCDTVPMIGRVGQLLQTDADPARVLADIAAKRAILDAIFRYEAQIDGEWGCCHDASRIRAGECLSTPVDSIEALRLLAAPYADRPGYSPAWAVGG